MNFYIVSGSPRINSQSIKVAKYVEFILKTKQLATNSYLLDIGSNPLPFWDESLVKNNNVWNKNWQNVANNLLISDALIIVVPEWEGMAPACLKNFFQLCNNGELAHKPGLIISVSAGINGVYPIAELRMSSYKNNKICYLPEHVIVRNVNSVLNNYNEVQNKEDLQIRERLEYAINVLTIYAKSFKEIRLHKILYEPKFKYGM